MRWRLRSVRTRILLLVLVPVLSLVGIYAFAISTTARDAVNLAKANTVKNTVGDPVAAFMAQVTTERTLAILYMSAPTGANLAKLELQETKTNTATSNLHTTLTSSTTVANASPAEKQAIAALLRDVATLPSLRAQVAAQIIPSSRAFGEYNAMVQGANQVLSAAIRQQNNATLVSQALAFVRMNQSGDLLAQENTLLTAGLASGHFSPSQLQQFTQLVGARRAFYSLTLPDLDPRYRAYYLRSLSPGALASLTSLENTVVSSRPGTLPPVSPIAWQQAVGSVGTGLSTAGLQAGDALTSQANDQSSATYLRLILLGGLGLLAIVVSIALSVWIGRRLVRELSDLRQSALELANERLPDVVTRLAAGEQVDVAEQSALPSTVATSDEVGQVREAFGTVQRTAVEAAVGQAQLRQGISHIFRNLARRSQSLLHRQLTLLDAMERRARDPQELDDLFRVDHLATRMRRHAESLIILSGEAPARGWRHPVPLVDVLRAAVAEVEDYTRIKVTATTQASLAGPAVGDVIHMIAELAENATIYSPPQTPVLITGSVVGQGFAVEIEDRGLGMTNAQRDEINAQLDNPPAFDLSGSDQLGLFVAGQLAKRQNIRVSLRSSPYGGTTAIVLIPRSLVVPEGATAPDTSSLPAGSGSQQRARHAIGSGLELTGAVDGQASPPSPLGSSPLGSSPLGSSLPESSPPGFSDWPPGPRSPLEPGPLDPGPLGPLERPSSPAAPSVPAGASALRSEWGPDLAWPETSPASSRESTDYPPLGHPDQVTVGGPAEFSSVRSGGGNGPGSVIPGTADPAAGDGLDESGLPRRVRQASLAPQLRSSPPRAAPSADLGIFSDSASSDQPLPERSPEETRVTMSAIQRGWERGRSVFDPADDHGDATPGSTDVPDVTDTMAAVDPDAARPTDQGQAADTGTSADSAAGQMDGGGADARTHRAED
jgi:signal transduction histidine kinase